MEPNLFDIKDGSVIPTAHCYTIAAYKNVIDEFGPNAGKIFAFCHYMYSLNEKTNPFALLPESEKEEVVTRQICPELDTESPVVREALETTAKLYETPMQRLFKGWKINVDNLGTYLQHTQWMDGKDGNITQILAVAKGYTGLREAYRQAYREYQEEQGNDMARGGVSLAYDEDDHDDIEI